MLEPSVITKVVKTLRESANVKLIIVGILVLGLQIPVPMIRSLIKEREGRRGGVVGEISSKWGQRQTLTGPVLTVPYKEIARGGDGRGQETLRYLHVLPEDLTIRGEIKPEIRYRGIFEAVVYTGEFEMTAHFSKIPSPEVKGGFGAGYSDIPVVLAIGISDPRGINEQPKVELNGEDCEIDPGIAGNDVFSSGISITIPEEDLSGPLDLTITVQLNGSEGISFLPLAKTTQVDVRSSWSSPSFTGAFLPYEREVLPEGFTAKWQVLDFNTDLPQQWVSSRQNFEGSAFGVDLYLPAGNYQKSMRIAKYAILFIAFTFAGIFFAEVTSKTLIHPIQYLLIGMAVTMFYVLLLSISEHLTFGISYLIACVSVISLIYAYTTGIFRSRGFSFLVTGILGVLYGYLYLLLQLSDYALLLGSIGLFLVLAAIMLSTRNFDWYSLRLSREESGEK